MLALPAEGFGKMKFSPALPAACDGDRVGLWFGGVKRVNKACSWVTERWICAVV